MNPPVEEHRRSPRIFTAVEIHYEVVHRQRAKVTVTRDLSIEGVCAFFDTPLSPGATLTLTLDLPGELSPLVTQAGVVWMHPLHRPTHPLYEAGLRFIDMDVLDRRRLLKYLTSVRPVLSE